MKCRVISTSLPPRRRRVGSGVNSNVRFKRETEEVVNIRRGWLEKSWRLVNQ